MTTPLVVTFVGDDRPGLVNAVADRIAASGGTWLESRSAQLAGKFAGVLLANAPDEKVAELEASLRGLESAGLHVTIDRGAAEKQKPRRLVRLEIVGHERPGIVRDVTRTLSALNVNIEEFSSDVEGAAFTGVEMFRAAARLEAPEGLPLDELLKALERLAGEIMVDLTVGEEEARR
jgi:glycine cleavage system regulatory protein